MGLLSPRGTAIQWGDVLLYSVERVDDHFMPFWLRKEMDFVASLLSSILKGPMLAVVVSWLALIVSCKSLQRSAGLRVQRVE